MENPSESLAKKLLEKARERQKEIDDCASPIRCPVNTGRISANNKENWNPLPQEACKKDVLTSASPPKVNHFTAFAEAFKNFEYEVCHVSKSKEDYLVGTPRKIDESFEVLSLENDDMKLSVSISDFEQIGNEINSLEKLKVLSIQNNVELDVQPEPEKFKHLIKAKKNEVSTIEGAFNGISVPEIKHMIDNVENDQKLFAKNIPTTTSTPFVSNIKAMDIAKKFDSASRNIRPLYKQGAVKYIDGKIAVKSLRPGALSPTLLYGNRNKIDMKNSEVVIPESASVKNLKSKWEANITSGVKIESNDKKVSHDNSSDEDKFLHKYLNFTENSPTEILEVEKCDILDECNPKENNSSNVLKTRTENVKSEVEEGHEDRIINDVFNFVHLEESAIPSPIFDCKVSQNLMDDINTELNRYSTPRSHLNEQRRLATDVAVDSPQRQLVHRISFYRKKAKEIEEVVRHNIDSVSSDVVSSSGCSGCGTSNGTHHNEDLCDENVDIETTIKKLQENIRVQQDQIAQASRAILYCRENDVFKGSREEIDAQRAFLIASEKKKVLSLEYEKIKKGGIPSSFSRDPRGTLSITKIAIKLSKEFIYKHNHQKVNPCIYYLIILVKIADRVFHTQLLSTETEIQNGYIEFPVHINLKNLPTNFIVLLEIFSLFMKKDPRHTKDAKSKSKTLTPFKRFSHSMPSSSVNQSIFSPNGIVNSSFHKIGVLTFNISHVNKKTFVLKDVKQPLEGIISLDMNCIPEKESSIEFKGFLNLYQFVGDLSSWNRYWCVLKGSNMVFWRYPEEEDKKQPAIIIDLESVRGDVQHINDESACFPNTMQLYVEVLDKSKLSTIRILFAADTLPQMESWLTYINETTKYISLWSSKKAVSDKKT